MSLSLLLQTGVCETYSSGADSLTDFEFIQAVTCTYTEAAGFFVTGTLVLTAVAGHIYLKTGSMILPFGLVLLAGGALLSVVAPPAVAAAGVLVLTFGAGAIAYLYFRFAR